MLQGPLVECSDFLTGPMLGFLWGYLWPYHIVTEHGSICSTGSCMTYSIPLASGSFVSFSSQVESLGLPSGHGIFAQVWALVSQATSLSFPGSAGSYKENGFQTVFWCFHPGTLLILSPESPSLFSSHPPGLTSAVINLVWYYSTLVPISVLHSWGPISCPSDSLFLSASLSLLAASHS